MNNEVKKEMLDYAAQLEAVTAQDYILYFDNGIACRFVKGDDGYQKSAPANILTADTIGNDKMPEEAWAFVPNVINGKGEKAKVCRRDLAAKKYAAELRELFA